MLTRFSRFARKGISGTFRYPFRGTSRDKLTVHFDRQAPRLASIIPTIVTDKNEGKDTTINDLLSTNKDTEAYTDKVFTQALKNLGVAFGTGAGFALVAPVAVTVYPPLAMLGIPMFLGGAGMGLWNAYKLGKVKPHYTFLEVDGKRNEIMTNEKERKKYANLIHVGMGMSLFPAMLVGIVLNPASVPLAVAGSCIFVGGPALSSMYLPKGKLLKYGPALYTGLLGLCVVGIGGFWFPILHSFNVYAGLGLFTVLSGYDTHRMIKDYEDGEKDYLGHSTTFSLNFLNVYVRLQEIMSGSFGDD